MNLNQHILMLIFQRNTQRPLGINDPQTQEDRKSMLLLTKSPVRTGGMVRLDPCSLLAMIVHILHAHLRFASGSLSIFLGKKF